MRAECLQDGGVGKEARWPRQHQQRWRPGEVSRGWGGGSGAAGAPRPGGEREEVGCSRPGLPRDPGARAGAALRGAWPGRAGGGRGPAEVGLRRWGWRGPAVLRCGRAWGWGGGGGPGPRKVSAARGVAATAASALPAAGMRRWGPGWRRASPGEAPSTAIFKGGKGSEESSRVTSSCGRPPGGSAPSRRAPPTVGGAGAGGRGRGGRRRPPRRSQRAL